MRRPLLAFGIAIGLASCRLVAGIDDRSVDPVVTPAICPEERAACNGDPACKQAFACLDACRGDVASVTACRIKCRRTLPTSFGKPASALLACQAPGLSCGGYLYADAECEACAKASCCGQAGACAANAECLDLTSCTSSCPVDDGPCRLNCESDHKAGVAARHDFDQCLDGTCQKACTNSAWACLGRALPEIPSGKVRVLVTAIDFVSNAPAAGVALSACSGDDPTCDGPVLGTTNEKGEATIELPSLTNGCLRFDGADFVPSCIVIDNGTPLLTPLIRRADRDRIFGGAPREKSGAVLAFIHDCTGVPGAGAQLTTTSGARTLYWRGGQLVADAFVTDTSGIAAMVDLPAPERRIVRAEVSSSLPPVHQIEVLIRPDLITYVNLEP